MPIGSNAVYAPAGIKDWTAFGVFLEEIIIINKPTAPLTPIKYNGAGWSGGSRCGDQGSTGVSAPLPSNYLVSDVDGNDTPNYPAAVMTADGNNYLQGQPLTHCTAGGPWTWLGLDYSTSIYGDGINGAQGGSHLSSVGGTIRLGEWSSRMTDEVARERMRRLDAAGFDKIGFAWVGADALHEPHYYRVQGPTFLVEFDEVQGNANHIHSVWRDFTGDWGEDVLADHYAHAHGVLKE